MESIQSAGGSLLLPPVSNSGSILGHVSVDWRRSLALYDMRPGAKISVYLYIHDDDGAVYRAEWNGRTIAEDADLDLCVDMAMDALWDADVRGTVEIIGFDDRTLTQWGSL